MVWWRRAKIAAWTRSCRSSLVQAAFRVQSPWSIKNPNGDNPNEEEILKPVCFVFDFAPTRALRQLADYGVGLSPNEPSPEKAVEDLISYLPVLAYDGSHMTQIGPHRPERDAAGVRASVRGSPGGSHAAFGPSSPSCPQDQNYAWLSARTADHGSPR
jgi:hypothetical protein